MGKLPDLDAFDHGQIAGVFKQEICTFHKSRLAVGWLDEHSSDLSVINWPARSPELNPFKYLGGVLEQGGKGHHTALMNLTELWTALANIWQVIPVERFHKLV
ncbi:transposable element Tcb2 transposase [Trichonephila clavipes]|nr:transposable element Tcb2 transposase [Trichonephila clavipes]